MQVSGLERIGHAARVLVVNTGSSSLKLRVVGDGDEVVARCDIDRWAGEHDTDDLERFLAEAPPVDVAGHRVVHGGADLTAPTVVDDDVEARIEALAELAPLHQPRAVAGIRAVRRLLPDVPQVACFDTAFHATLPPAAATYALPAAWRARWGLRRFGFHGLSHAWAVRRAAAIVSGSGGGSDRARAPRRVISCHLGAGASLCAALDGRSVDTTMGFTPTEGLVMATRSGSVDPGLIAWLVDRGGLAASEVADALEHRSGLAGLTGTSGDMREVLAARRSGDADATAAFDVYIHRLRRELAGMAAALGGVDVVAFTGGVGEHAAEVRVAAVDGLGFLGLAVDPAANDATTADGDVSAAGARAATVVVTAREELEIARGVRDLVARRDG